MLLPAGSRWQSARFGLAASDLVLLAGSATALLGDVTVLRLFHGGFGAPTFPGPRIAAVGGVDNVTAVPEPATAALWLAGLAGLAAAARRRAAPPG